MSKVYVLGSKSNLWYHKKWFKISLLILSVFLLIFLFGDTKIKVKGNIKIEIKSDQVKDSIVDYGIIVPIRVWINKYTKLVYLFNNSPPARVPINTAGIDEQGGAFC